MMFNAERIGIGSVVVFPSVSENVLYFFISVMRLLEGVEDAQGALISAIFRSIISPSTVL